MNPFIEGDLAQAAKMRGDSWRMSEVRDMCVQDILIGNHFQRRAKTVSDDLKTATKTCEGAQQLFNTTFDAMLKAQERVTEGAKRTSTSIRKSTDELGQAMARLEKAVNFDRLERCVALLERSASALSTLAQLEQDGKLDKVIAAIK